MDSDAPQPDPAHAGQPIGGLLRDARKGRGLTLAAVAERVGATKGYLSQVENGRVANPPSRTLLIALAEALGLDREALLAAAAWQRTPARVRDQVEQLADRAAKGRELAAWLRDAARGEGDTTPTVHGGLDLDALHRTGSLQRRVEAVLGEEMHAAETPASTPLPAAVRGRVPLINRVAAGYPTDFTDLDYPARVADDYVHAPGLVDPDAFAANVFGESMHPEYREGDIVVFSPLADVEDGCDCFVRIETTHETTFKRVFFEEGGEQIRLQPLNPKFPPMTLAREDVAGLYRAVWRFSKL